MKTVVLIIGNKR